MGIQSNEKNKDICQQLLTARTVSSVTVGSLEKEDDDRGERQNLPNELSPTLEQYFTLQSKRTSPSNHPQQHAMYVRIKSFLTHKITEPENQHKDTRSGWPRITQKPT